MVKDRIFVSFFQIFFLLMKINGRSYQPAGEGSTMLQDWYHLQVDAVAGGCNETGPRQGMAAEYP